jgi:ferrochelatase
MRSAGERRSTKEPTMAATGVLLVTLGGPRTRDEVPVFLRRFIGRELPPPALQSAVERYDLIGGHSPLDEITERQAAALGAQLGPGFVCRAAFRHSEPSIEAQLGALRGAGVERLVFLLASPFFASVTTGNYLEHAQRVLAESGWGVDVLWLHSWYDSPQFASAWTNKLAQESPEPSATYLFSAHSLPDRLSREPYRGQIGSVCSTVAAHLGIAQWKLGWQSVPAGAREPWIGPQVEELLDGFKRDGVRQVVQVPLGFTADHIETLYDIDVVHRAHAEQLGLSWRRVSSLNDDPAFIRALAHVLREALAAPERHRA